MIRGWRKLIVTIITILFLYLGAKTILSPEIYETYARYVVYTSIALMGANAFVHLKDVIQADKMR